MINCVFKDNREACTQVDDGTVRHFISLAAARLAPRYIRLLANLVAPDGSPIMRNQVSSD